MATIYCGHCGSDMPDDTAFCMACGTSMDPRSGGSQPSAPPPRTAQPQQQWPKHPPPQPHYGQPPQYPPQYTQYQQYPPQYQQQPYYQEPQYAPPQPPPSGLGAGRILAYFALACVGIAAVGALVVMGFTLLKPDGPGAGEGIVQSQPSVPGAGEEIAQPKPDGPGAGEETVQWHATYDQNRVLDEFGPPQAFVIGYGEDHLDQATGDGPLAVHRVETWDYWDMRTRFEFKDGIAIGTQELPALDTPVYTPAYSPLDFSLGISSEQVAGFMQVGPSATASLDQELFPGMSIESFFDELYVSYQDGGLVGVESSLLSLEGGS